MLGDLNARLGDVAIEGMIEEHLVPGVNKNGLKLVELCIDRGMAIGNTWFKKKYINKYTLVSGTEDQGALLFYVLFERCAKDMLLDVNMLRGKAG